MTYLAKMPRLRLEKERGTKMNWPGVSVMIKFLALNFLNFVFGGVLIFAIYNFSQGKIGLALSNILFCLAIGWISYDIFRDMIATTIANAWVILEKAKDKAAKS